TYPILTKSNANDLFNELDSLKPNYVTASKFNTVLFSDSQKRGAKFKYKFVAPKDGFYKFENTYDDYIKVFVNDELVYREDRFTNQFKKTYEKEMKKGEVIEFENQIINTGGSGGFDLKIKYRQSENDTNEEELDKMSNIISPTLNDNFNYLELLNDSKYKYKIREINREIFNKSLTSIHNLSTYSLKDSIIESYTLTSPGRNVDNLKNYNDTIVEIWGPNNGNPASLELNFSFDTPQYLSSIYVAGRTNNWTNARPSKIKVLGYADDSDSDEIVLYDGDYGNQFGDRFSDISKLNFTNPKTVKRAKVILINENMISGNQSCISLKWVKLSNYKFIKMSNSYGFNNPLMNVSSGWSFRENDDFNSSALSNLYVNSIDEKNKITFTLNNC
ncbi:MAG: hypothetical protein K2I49_01655, partial [Ureaplasma sp.]|nr:hypothetical protein [Ureaplasma sp.]